MRDVVKQTKNRSRTEGGKERKGRETDEENERKVEAKESVMSTDGECVRGGPMKLLMLCAGATSCATAGGGGMGRPQPGTENVFLVPCRF